MDQRTVLAIGLSFALLMAYQVFLSVYYPTPEQGTEIILQDDGSPVEGGVDSDVVVGKGATGPVLETDGAKPQPVAQPVVYDPGPTASFENSLVSGQISLNGGQLIDLRFFKHLTEMGENGEPIQYLNGSGPQQFFSESGFLSTPGLKMPGRDTNWQLAKGSGNLDEGEILLVWDNGAGLQFEKRLEFNRDSYLMTITDRVVNHTGEEIPVYHFAQLVRIRPEVSPDQAMAIADFEGPIGYLDGVRVLNAYDDIITQDYSQKAMEGWAGFSDKFFLAAMIPGPEAKERKYYFDYDAPSYRVGVVSPKKSLKSDSDLVSSLQYFIGPKEIRTLEAQNLNLERAIDYGWFHFLAVPLVQILLFFNDFFHNYGVAIIFLTILIKLLFFPLANKSYHSMAAMKKLQPKVEELRKNYKDDKQRMNQEMMKLYQDNKVNPLGGCLPIAVQIPVFFALYKVLFLSIEMRHTPFFLWVQDLSVQDPYYVLPVLMGISMFIQSRMNPAPADPVQAKVMMLLPVVFTIFFLTFPSGLVLYWLVNNTLSILQQGYIMKKTA
ncbi:MAG: membrane protein insertase YidC [Magnetococcales bacterium]|nr:membrane protein insertase YidC [Magnetococcales bacterium]